MPPKTAVQLYSMRDLAAKNYADVVRKVAAMGYDGVETAGFPNTTPQAAAILFKELNLAVAGAHSPLPLGDQKNEVLETAALLGCKYVVCPHIGPNDVKDMDAIQNLCSRLNESQANAKAAGMPLVIHNHWWEYAQMDGRLIADIMIDLLEPGICFELDTYWIKVAGVDPAARVRQLGKRAPLLHIKDGPGVREEPHTAVGTGIMDFAEIYKANRAAEWWIVELDSCATDVMEAVRQSQIFIKGMLK